MAFFLDLKLVNAGHVDGEATQKGVESPAQIETPGLSWSLVVNQRPQYPYVQFDRIVNPWGFGSFQVALRLDDSATLEFVVRGSTTETISTSIPAAITGSPAEQTVTPLSMSNIKVGSRLIIDTNAAEEEVIATSVTPTTFSAIFRNNHASSVKVSRTAVAKVGGRILGRFWYNPGYGDVERRR